MNHLSEVVGFLSAFAAKKLVWQAASALGVAAARAAVLAEHDKCLTYWVIRVPGEGHGQVSVGPVSAGLYQCYG
jgi:hypothetical protein